MAHVHNTLQWGTVEADTKDPSSENQELKGFPMKAWSRCEYSYACFTCCQGFLPCLFLPCRSIQLFFVVVVFTKPFLSFSC